MYKLFLFLSIISFISCKNTVEQKVDTAYISAFKSKPGMEVIQFHMEHRCKTCMKIEEVTKKAIVGYENLPFKLVNIEQEENDAMAREFKAAGTALFLFDPATGKKVELTDFAFMNAFEDETFIKGLQKEIDQF